MTPLFSVIIPTYNRLDLLRETLASVLAQEFSDYELNIVDDGSTDGTRDWLRTLGNNVRVFTQTNLGAGPARNLGLVHSRGEYVAFLDSDDLWFSWSLATYAEVIEQYDRPSFITAAVVKFEHPHVPVHVDRKPISVKVFADYYASGDMWRWYGMSSFVVKRTCLQEVGGFTTEPINTEDTDLSMRLGASPGFVHIQSPTTIAYREHAGGVRHVTSKAFAGAYNMLRHDALGNYPGGPSRSWERWRLLGRHVRPCALRCLQQGLRSEAWQLYRAMWWRHLRECRWRFLLGFPLMAAAGAARRSAVFRMCRATERVVE